MNAPTPHESASNRESLQRMMYSVAIKDFYDIFKLCMTGDDDNKPDLAVRPDSLPGGRLREAEKIAITDWRDGALSVGAYWPGEDNGWFICSENRQAFNFLFLGQDLGHLSEDDFACMVGPRFETISTIMGELHDLRNYLEEGIAVVAPDMS